MCISTSGEIKNTAEDFCGILCIVSSDKDFIVVSPNSCVDCTEKKLNLTVYDVFPLKRQDCNEWRKYGAALYNVKCECGSSQLNKRWNSRLKPESK